MHIESKKLLDSGHLIFCLIISCFFAFLSKISWECINFLESVYENAIYDVWKCDNLNAQILEIEAKYLMLRSRFAFRYPNIIPYDLNIYFHIITLFEAAGAIIFKVFGEYHARMEQIYSGNLIIFFILRS